MSPVPQSYVEQTISVNGLPAQLTTFGEYVASIVMPNGKTEFRRGDALRLTVFLNLMNKQVPLTLQSEVVQPHENAIEVMYAPPIRNWRRVLHNLKRRPLLF